MTKAEIERKIGELSYLKLENEELKEYNKEIEQKYIDAKQELKELQARYDSITADETDSKEVLDALHMLLHCALKDKEFDTQKEQFQLINSYIKQLEDKTK